MTRVVLRTKASQSTTMGSRVKRKRVLTLSSIPLQTILVRDLSKAVLRDGSQRRIVQMVVVDLGTKIELSLGLELVVESTCSS